MEISLFGILTKVSWPDSSKDSRKKKNQMETGTPQITKFALLFPNPHTILPLPLSIIIFRYKGSRPAMTLGFLTNFFEWAPFSKLYVMVGGAIIHWYFKSTSNTWRWSDYQKNTWRWGGVM